jgi:putative tryptophan/tyrosine transport system substrate-binding protein
MNRRELMLLLGGTAVAWPLPPRAQQLERVRRVGVVGINVPERTVVNVAFEDGLRSFGWANGGNLRIDYRSFEANTERMRSAARDIIALDPAVVLAQTTPIIRELLAITRSVPIVFVQVSDPIGSGFVVSFAQPGGNVTGFTDFEASLASKWLQLLKEVAPAVIRAALLFNPETAPGRGSFFLDPFQAAGPALGVMAMPAAVHDVHEIETALATLGADPGSGLVVAPDIYVASRGLEIVALAERFRLPAVYPNCRIARTGGLLSYCIDIPDLWTRAASYVDRILKGAKPADLPVQQPTKFDLIVNLKTANALGLTVPPLILARATEVIE